MMTFTHKQKYWYFNRHSAWEQVKFLGTFVNAVSKRTYYRFSNFGSKEVILTERQTDAYIKNL